MTKYTRSIEKLTALIKDIFSESDISIDTKAIVLVLAATMDSNKFISLISPLENLSILRSKLLAINDLRCRFGDLYRDYIILYALQASKRDISSDELQQFISNVDSADAVITDDLMPALSLADLEIEKNWQQEIDPQNFALTHEKAAQYLLQHLVSDHHNQIQVITDAYLHCRTIEQPLFAYYAVIYAMTDILSAGGIEAKYALLYSYKIARGALNKFIQKPDSNNILHSYKSHTT